MIVASASLSARSDSLGYEVRGADVVYGQRVYVFAFWYTKAEKIPHADGRTFKALDRTTYGKDAGAAYFEGQMIPGADAATFEMVSESGGRRSRLYARDTRCVYFEGSPLTDADPGSFQPDRGKVGLARDRRQVYLGRSVIRGADPATYRLLGADSLIGRDRRTYYFGVEPVTVRDPDSFEVLTANPAPGEVWARDSQAFYVGPKTTSTTGSAKLEILGNGYAKDATRVYYKGEPVAGADPETFSVRVYKNDVVKGETLVVARDRRNFYTSDIATGEIADGASFEELGRGYARDSKQVYYLSSVVEGADPGSFSVVAVNGIPGTSKSAPVVQDRSRYYQFGNPVGNRQ